MTKDKSKPQERVNKATIEQIKDAKTQIDKFLLEQEKSTQKLEKIKPVLDNLLLLLNKENLDKNNKIKNACKGFFIITFTLLFELIISEFVVKDLTYSWSIDPLKNNLVFLIISILCVAAMAAVNEYNRPKYAESSCIHSLIISIAFVISTIAPISSKFFNNSVDGFIALNSAFTILIISANLTPNDK